MVYFRIKIKCGNITPKSTKKIGKKKDMKVSEIASNFEGGIVEYLEHESNGVNDDVGEDSLCTFNQKNDADVTVTKNENKVEDVDENMMNINNENIYYKSNNNEIMNKINYHNHSNSNEKVNVDMTDNKVETNTNSDTATSLPSSTSKTAYNKSHQFSDWHSVTAAHMIDMWADLMGVKTLGCQLGGKNPGV
jgi:hypothetical protein